MVTSPIMVVSHDPADNLKQHRASVCPESEEIINEHDLEAEEHFLQLLTDDKVPEKLPLTADEHEVLTALAAKFEGRKVVCSVCYACANIPKGHDLWWKWRLRLRPKPYVPRPAEMELEELVRHMRSRFVLSFCSVVSCLLMEMLFQAWEMCSGGGCSISAATAIRP